MVYVWVLLLFFFFFEFTSFYSISFFLNFCVCSLFTVRCVCMYMCISVCLMRVMNFFVHSVRNCFYFFFFVVVSLLLLIIVRVSNTCLILGFLTLYTLYCVWTEWSIFNRRSSTWFSGINQRIIDFIIWVQRQMSRLFMWENREFSHLHFFGIWCSVKLRCKYTNRWCKMAKWFKKKKQSKKEEYIYKCNIQLSRV